MPARSQLRALMLAANPHGIEDFNLVPIDVESEVRRVRAAMGDLSLTVLGGGAGAATLTGLVNALEHDYPIVYLACHRALRRGEPTLYLEDEGRACARVMGSKLVRVISELPADTRCSAITTLRPTALVFVKSLPAGIGVGEGLKPVEVAGIGDQGGAGDNTLGRGRAVDLAHEGANATRILCKVVTSCLQQWYMLLLRTAGLRRGDTPFPLIPWPP